jgi:hypothetical protein
VRSILSALASAWFVYAAITLSAPTIVDVARLLFVGLALLAAAGVDWGAAGRRIDDLDIKPDH